MVKLFKYRKLVICVMIILGVAFYFTAKHITGNHITSSDVHHTYTGLSYIHSSGVIDKNIVVRSLSSVQQLTGTEGHVTKSYTYIDSLFKENGWIKNVIGQRTVEMSVDAYFKMGINLSDIAVDDISAYGNTLFIKLPKQVLISMDVPYDEIIFNTKKGLMRSGMSEAEKQTMYSEVRKLLTNNVLGDQKIVDQSEQGVKEALTNLLEKIPNCNRIVFKTKL